MTEKKHSHKQIWKPILIFSSAFFGYGMLSMFLDQRFGTDAYAIGRFLYAILCLILYLFSMPKLLLKQELQIFIYRLDFQLQHLLEIHFS